MPDKAEISTCLLAIPTVTFQVKDLNLAATRPATRAAGEGDHSYINSSGEADGGIAICIFSGRTKRSGDGHRRANSGGGRAACEATGNRYARILL